MCKLCEGVEERGSGGGAGGLGSRKGVVRSVCNGKLFGKEGRLMKHAGRTPGNVQRGWKGWGFGGEVAKHVGLISNHIKQKIL